MVNDRYNQPAKGSSDWDVPLNENFDDLDIDVTHAVQSFGDLPSQSNVEQSSHGQWPTYYVRDGNVVVRVTDSSTEVVSGGNRRIDARVHGADPTGASASDQALTDAVAVADAGDLIVFPDGSYSLTSSHTISKAVRIATPQGHFTDDRSSVTVGDALIHFQGGGAQSSTTLSSAANRGDPTIDVTDDTIFSAGDIIRIQEGSAAESIITDYAEVESVGTGTLTLVGTVQRDFASGSDVDVMSMLDRPGAEDLEIRNAATDGGYLFYEFCNRPVVSRLEFPDFYRYCVKFYDCIKPLAMNSTAKNAAATGSGEGEPWQTRSSVDSVYRNITAKGVRRGIDAGVGCTGFHVYDPTVEDFSLAGVSDHQATVSDTRVYGGEVITDKSVAGGISIGRNAEFSYVSGTRIVSGRRCLRILSPATIEGVEMEHNRNSTSGSPRSVRISASDVSIEDSVLNIPVYTDFQQSVYIDDSEGAIANVNVELTIDIGSVSTASTSPTCDVITSDGNGISDVDLDLTYADNTGLDQPLVRFYGSNALVENCSATVDADGHGAQGVVMRGGTGYSGVHVENCRLRTDHICVQVYGFDSTATSELIWVKNNDLASVNQDEIDFQEDGTDRAWIVDNAAASILVDSSATNIVQRGNQ